MAWFRLEGMKSVESWRLRAKWRSESEIWGKEKQKKKKKGGGGGTGGGGNVNALRIVGGSAEQHEGLDIYLVGSAGELAAVQAIAADAPDLSMLVVEA
jgi:hypothetical protein